MLFEYETPVIKPTSFQGMLSWPPGGYQPNSYIWASSILYFLPPSNQSSLLVVKSVPIHGFGPLGWWWCGHEPAATLWLFEWVHWCWVFDRAVPKLHLFISVISHPKHYHVSSKTMNYTVLRMSDSTTCFNKFVVRHWLWDWEWCWWWSSTTHHWSNPRTTPVTTCSWEGTEIRNEYMCQERNVSIQNQKVSYGTSMWVHVPNACEDTVSSVCCLLDTC